MFWLKKCLGNSVNLPSTYDRSEELRVDVDRETATQEKDCFGVEMTDAPEYTLS